MSSPEQDRMPIGSDDLRSERRPGDPEPAVAKRAWTPPTVRTFKVTDTQGIGFGFDDGINNITNNG